MLKHTGRTINSMIAKSASLALWALSAMALLLPGGQAMAQTAPSFIQVSGSANYTGSMRAFITVATGQRGPVGASVASGPGTYTINGLPLGLFPIFAFVDTHGTGTPHQSDPYFEGFIDTTTTIFDINFTTPTPMAPVTPAWVEVSPVGGGGVVKWDMPLDGKAVEVADSYSVYWSTTPNPGPGNTAGGGSKNVIASKENHLILTGLTDGLYYYATVTAWNGSTESAPSQAAGPVRIGAAATGVTVSGTVNFSGITPTGPLYVVLENDKSDAIHAAWVTAPVSPQPFTISSVPDGAFRLFSFIDMNNSQTLDDGDYRVATDQDPIVIVSGTPVSGAALTIPASNASAAVRSRHYKNPTDMYEGYSLDFWVEPGAKRAVTATLSSGPFMSGDGDQVDLGTFKGDPLLTWFSLSAGNIPAPGDTYTINAAYTDGSTEDLFPAVSAVLEDFAVPQSPAASSSVNSGPYFSWSEPVPPPSYPYTYSLRLQDMYGMQLWRSDSRLPPSQLSAPYNFDKSALPSPLVAGQTYRWSVVIQDSNGNSSEIETPFTYDDTTPPAVLTTTPAAGASNIGLYSEILASFNDVMDWGSINSLSFTLNNGAAGKVSYDAFARTAVFKPTSQLLPGTTYMATVAGSVRDAGGNTLAVPYSWSFTTGSSGQVMTGSDGVTIDRVTFDLTGAKIDLPAGTLLKDSIGTPLAGTLSISASAMATKNALPTAAQLGHLTDGSSLTAVGAAIDIAITGSGGSVKSITPSMLVNLAVPSTFAAPGATIPYYSFNGTSWNQEGTATVKTDGTVDMVVTHLSLWAVAQFQLFPNGILIATTGKVVPNIADALAALRKAIGLDPVTATDLSKGDVAPLVNGLPAPDGSITVGDAVVILQKALGVVNW